MTTLSHSLFLSLEGISPWVLHPNRRHTMFMCLSPQSVKFTYELTYTQFYFRKRKVDLSLKIIYTHKKRKRNLNTLKKYLYLLGYI